MSKKNILVTSAAALSLLIGSAAIAATGGNMGNAAASATAQKAKAAMHQAAGQTAGYRDWTQAQMKSLQQALISKGYQVQASGTWDAQTRAAVVQFQKKNGMKATGFPNAATRHALGLDW